MSAKAHEIIGTLAALDVMQSDGRGGFVPSVRLSPSSGVLERWDAATMAYVGVGETPTGYTYSVIGDSKSAQAISAGTSGFRTLHRGYWNQAVNLSGVPMKFVSNAAVGGYKLADMLANFDAKVAAYSPDVVFFYGGVNDIYAAVGSQTSMADIFTALEAIYNKCSAIGAKVIRVGIPPAGSSIAAYYTKTLIAKVKRINRWDEEYCRNKGWKFIDPWRADIHGQPTDASGYAVAANYYETQIHESAIGAYLLGKAVATEIVALTGYTRPANSLVNTYVDTVTNARQTITSLTGNGTTATAALAGHPFVVGDKLPIWSSSNTAENVKDYYGVKTVTAITSSTFSYACTDSSATTGTLYCSTGFNHVENPLLTGTTGTKTVVTGNIADGWDAVATAGMTVAATQVGHTKWDSLPGSVDAADLDGNGNWQQFDITSAANNDVVSYAYAVPDTKALRGGANYYAEVEVEIFGTIANLRAVHLNYAASWTASGVYLSGVDIRDGWDYTATDVGPTTSRKLILRTPIWNAYLKEATTLTNDTLYPVGTFGLDSAAKEVTIGLEFAGVGGCSVRIGLPALKRVD